MPKEIPIKITIDNKKAKKKADELKKKVKEVGTEGKKAGDKVGKGFVGGFRAAKKSILSAKNAMMGFVAIATTGAFVTMAVESLKAADHIAKTANKIGLTTDALQEYQYAASQSGINMRTFNMSFQRFGRRIAEVAVGTGELLKTTQMYNFEVKNQHGGIKDINSLFSEYGELIRTAATDQEALRLAFKAFDSEGAVMVNLFRGGTKTLEEYQKQARELGLVLSSEVIAKSTEVTDKLDILKKQLGKTFTEAIVDNAASIASSFSVIAKGAGIIAKIAGLTSLITTNTEATRLQAEGLLDISEFERKSVFEKQKILERILEIENDTAAARQRGPTSRPRLGKNREAITGGAPPESEQQRLKREAIEKENLRLETILAEEQYTQRMLELSEELDFQVNKESRNRKAGSEAIIQMIKNETAAEDYAMQQWSEGWDGVFDDWGDSIEVAENKFAGLADHIKNYSHTMSSAFADFAMGAKVSISDMVNSMIKDFIRLAAQQMIFGPMMGALGGMIGGGPAIVNHTGSDSIGMTRKIPKLHAGLRGNEYPAILEKGEGVSTKEQNRAGQAMTINMTVVKGAQEKTTMSEQQGGSGLEKQLTLIIGKDIAQGGAVAGAIEGTYGVQRRGRRV
jgi:hypothetical protein